MDQEAKVYEIRGTVTGRKSEPLRSVRVVAWWQHIRERKELAAGATSESGTYHLKYEVPANAPQPLLLVVEALSEYLDAPLFSPLTPAQPTLEIDLNFETPDQSEWTLLMRSIEPSLDNLKLSDLTQNSSHQDISFLASQVGKSTEVIMRAAVSARLDAAFKIPAPAFYAFLRQQVPSALPSPLLDASQNFTLIDTLMHRVGSLIFGLSAQVQTQTLTAAVALDLIGPQFTTQIPQLVSQLQALHTTDLLNQPYLSGNATLAQLLDVAALPQAKQQTFAQALVTNTQPMSDFWVTLGDGQHGFTAAEASSIQRTMSIGAFVGNFVPLLQNLVQGFTSGTYKALSDLARLSLHDWVQLVNKTGLPPDAQAATVPGGVAAATPPGAAARTASPVIASPAQAFASSVYARVTGAYPTAALSSRVATGSFVPPVQRQPLALFFQNNPNLELVTNNIPAYLANQGQKAFVGISQADQAAVVANARSFQRVLRVAPNPDAAQTLLGLGIKSSTQIATMGQQQFLLKATTAGLTQTDALQTFQGAAQKYANVVALYMQFNNESLGVWPKAMGRLSDLNQTVQQAIQRDQSLATLFGSQDFCATDDCTSILSPAAYLCDLLLWLRNHPQGTQTALDILDIRRPDIRHLLLNCPNTDTELPYIDLVNELLADQISPPVSSLSTWLEQTGLSDGVTNYYLVTAVNSAGESLPSSQISAIPEAPSVPAPPLGVTVTPGDGQATISWKAVAGATAYNVYFGTTGGPPPAQIASVANPYTLTGLTNGLTYNFGVTAVNSTGESAFSTIVPAQPTTAISPPSGVTVTPGDAQVTIAWPAVSGANSYNIYWATAPGVTITSGTQIPGASNPYIQAGLVNFTSTYYYVVTAVNSTGETATSAEVSTTPYLPSTAPSIAPVVSAIPGDSRIVLSWNAVQDATGYNVYWSTTSGLPPSQMTRIDDPRNPLWKQTSADKTAADLRAAPEYFSQSACVMLFGAGYPFTLPYSAGLDALRTYLLHWNLPLWQLRQALLPIGGANIPQQSAVAAERFGIAPLSEVLVTTSVAPSSLNPAAVARAWNNSDPVTNLASVPAFIQAASLTYESLLELLQVDWVQAGSRLLVGVNVSIQGIDDTCMTSVQTLSPLNLGFLDRAHRFLRLWLATGYKMWEFDLLLSAGLVGNGTLDQKALAALLSFRQLQDATGLAVDQLLAFYQDIDTVSHRDPDGTVTTSLYARIFLDKPVVSIGPDPDLVALPTGGAIADPVLGDHQTVIQAALGVSSADAAALFALTDNQLTLDNLSLVYRVNALAVASKFPISSLITVASLLQPKAASTAAALTLLLASPSATLEFLEQAKAVQQSGFTVDALTYLLTPPSATGLWPTTTQMTLAEIAATLIEVEQTLLNMPVASTTLASAITSSTNSITVTSTGFPLAPFYVPIGSEIVQVTKITGNSWTVSRGQQGTTAMAAVAGASVGGDLKGSVVDVVAANARHGSGLALAKDVTALILKTLDVPPLSGQSLLSLLMDTSFLAAGAITIGGSPTAGDTLQAVLSDGVNTVTVPPYTVTLNDSGNVNQTASDFADQINTSAAVIGSNAFLAPCAVSSAVITLMPLKPGAAGIIITSSNTTTPFLGHVSVSAGTTTPVATAQIVIGGAPALNDTLTAILNDGTNTAPVTYQVTLAEIGDINKTASSFAQAIDAAQDFAGVSVLNNIITVVPLTAGTITSGNSTTGNVSVSAGTPTLLWTIQIVISGSPTAGDTLQSTLSDVTSVSVLYTVTLADTGDIDQTASTFAQAINTSQSFAGSKARPGGIITVWPLINTTIASVNTTTPAIGHVSVSPGTTTAIGPLAFPNQFLALQLFDKVAVLVRALRLQTTDLFWLITNAGVYGGLDFTQLPVAPSQALLGLFPLLDTLRLIKLARLWTANLPKRLYDIISGIGVTLTTQAAIQAALAAITNWPLADIASFAAALGLNFRTGYYAPATYDALRTLEAMATAAGATGSQIVSWGAVPPNEPAAESMAADALASLKAQQPDNNTWLALLPALNNPMRDRRSAALQAWLIAQTDPITGNPIYGDANGLFDYFLIDVQMSSCQVTSRVVQAYIAVQIFVERCRMNLEAPQVVVDLTLDDTWNQWQWMSRYRIWEANREIFLYPENWLLEAERPSRTEIFQKLEQEVRQGQSTADYLETVVLNYIDRLDGLAHLLVTGTCQDPVTGSIHVVARSHADPPVFYLRSFVNGTWTGWAEIPLGIKAHQVAPALYRGRLCLFWLDITISNEPHQTSSSTNVDQYVTLSVYFSMFRNGFWAPAQASKGKLFDKPHLDPSKASDTKTVEALYTLKVLPSIGDVTVSLDTNNTGTAPNIDALCNITIGGSPQAGDIIQIVLTNTPNLSTLSTSVTVSYTLVSADANNISQTAFDLMMAINNSLKMIVYLAGGWPFGVTPYSPTYKVAPWGGATFTLYVFNGSGSTNVTATVIPAVPAPVSRYAANLWLDVFRLGDYAAGTPFAWVSAGSGEFWAVHIGRAVFDGRFSDLELNNLPTVDGNLLQHAQDKYGSDAHPLLPLASSETDADLTGVPSSLTPPTLVPKSGALATLPADPSGANTTAVLSFDPAPLQYGALALITARVPFRVVGPDTKLAFDPTSYFFFQDNRRCYWVESQKNWVYFVLPPVGRGIAAYEMEYFFHPFYHPFTRLFWNQLAGGGFDSLYDPSLQQAPDAIDPNYSDVFSFNIGYQPNLEVQWDLADAGTSLAAPLAVSDTTMQVTNNIWIPSPAFSVSVGSETIQVTGIDATNSTTWAISRGISPVSALAGDPVAPTPTSQDRQFLDFSYRAAFSVYNWELFYHIPLYIAQLLSQNQQFEDARTWFHYIFNPTRQGSDPVPQRFWIPKPLHNLTSTQILQQQINNLLLAVNQGDAAAVLEVENWRKNAFNPFLLADLRNGVPYMKSTVMSYLDNLVAWGDNLFSSESREALSEATLLYVIASEILGPQPVAVTPPQHADESFDQLELSLDAFANAMVEIENVIGGADGGGGAGNNPGNIPGPQTFYFKIPSNAKLLGYWTTVADRLYKLRHCQNIAGAPLQLALFDAPIDPGLLIAAQAAGVDLSSVLSDLGAPLPNYRFTALYQQASDFIGALRTYGGSLLGAIEKSDGGAFTLLQQTTAQQLLKDGGDILDWQIQKAQCDIDNTNDAINLNQHKRDWNAKQAQAPVNVFEGTAATLKTTSALMKAIAATSHAAAAVLNVIPTGTLGFLGIAPIATIEAPKPAKEAEHHGHFSANYADLIAIGADLATTFGAWQRRQEAWNEAAAEAQYALDQANIQLKGLNLAFSIAQKNKDQHQEQIDNAQKQIDFVTNKFSNNSLYDWMVSSLSATYFQSYQLAYQMCKQVERCYQFELGIRNTSFIQFGYWDSLHKGLLAGETLNHDLRRMQASYLQQNARRYELSRYVSLGLLDPVQLQNLLVYGFCDFTLPESLFDNDYPGHYNRRLTRVSVTVVYPSPGKFDNVKATLTLVSNRVRISADGSSTAYAETPVGSDPRFLYNWAAVPQKIAMGNAQDDPGLFVTAIASNISDQRYLPFENAGAISSWHLEMPQANNEVDLSTVGDVMLHLYYTALDGGASFQTDVQTYNSANMPTSGVKVFSALNDFGAGSPTVDNPYPSSPWQTFLGTQKSLLNAEAMQTDGTQRWQVFKPAGNVSVSPISTLPATTAFTITIGGSPTAGDILKTILTPGGVTVSYTLTPADSGDISQTASDFAQEIINTAAAKALVTCTASGAVITLTPLSGSVASTNSATPASVPQVLTLSISPSKFPAWTRGKTITVTAVTVVTFSPVLETFVLAPQSPLATTSVTMTQLTSAAPPYVCSVTVAPASTITLAQSVSLSFELQLFGAPDFTKLTKSEISDVLLLVSYTAS
jgi:hypothetical protein